MQPAPVTPSHRLRMPPWAWNLLLSRRFWVVVASTALVVVLVFSLATVPAGPVPWKVEMVGTNCLCQRNLTEQYSFPDRATITFRFVSYFPGPPAEYDFIVLDPAGTPVVYAPIEYGTLGPVNNANVSGNWATTSGGVYTFVVMATDPDQLPDVTCYINGTISAPYLS